MTERNREAQEPLTPNKALLTYKAAVETFHDSPTAQAVFLAVKCNQNGILISEFESSLFEGNFTGKRSEKKKLEAECVMKKSFIFEGLKHEETAKILNGYYIFIGLPPHSTNPESIRLREEAYEGYAIDLAEQFHST